jgi:hypothetical protein
MSKDGRPDDTSLERASRLVERSRQRISRTIERVDRALMRAQESRVHESRDVRPARRRDGAEE